MSGVFCLLRFENETDGILPATEGGPPHTTILYCKGQLAHRELRSVISQFALDWDYQDPLRVDSVSSNSFFKESSNSMRHDTFLCFDEESENRLRRVGESITTTFPSQKGRIDGQHYHITVASDYSLSEHKASQEHWQQKIPRNVKVLGFYCM